MTSAQSVRELTNALASGLFIPLTNNAWIAIRYVHSHAGGPFSCAVARDSGGAWFESDRGFCGFFALWSHVKLQIEGEKEMKRLDPEYSPKHPSIAEQNDGVTPSYQEMVAIESAPDLESARRTLQKIGFRPLHHERRADALTLP
jgi:hypothetical protein